ncbi:MAG: sodium/glutamate symporter [Lachnospiraceae bacterium]|nr:sodium/glutamate symporter [Lachnospiraceae bacterium]
MRRRVSALFIVVMLMFTLLTGCGQKKEDDFTFGTGGEGGNYFSYGTNLAEKLESETGYQIGVKTTAASIANLRLISGGYLDFALVQSDNLYDAIHGKGEFEGKPLTGFHAVAGVYTEVVQIVVAADGEIASIEDLDGKVVSIGEKDSGVMQNALQVLNAYGLKHVKQEYMSYQDAAEALKNGEIDAFFCTAGAPTTAIVNLEEEMELRILPMSNSVAMRLLQNNESYVISDIPANTYKNQEESICTVGVTAVVVASDSVPAEVEEALLTILKNENRQLQEISFGTAPEQKEEGTFTIKLDMYMTLALAVGVLFLGAFLRKKVKFLETFCIPAPVIGGIIFAIISCVCHATGIVEFSFDETLKNICMIIFFTSVGFQANLKVLKSGGVGLVIFLLCVAGLIFCQNGISVGISKLLHVDPRVGLCTGSIPMVGGHGTAGAFGLVLEDLGLEGATTLCTAAATFGLIIGSLMGGPIGRRLIVKHDLLKTVHEEDASVLIEDEKKHHRRVSMYAPAAYQIAIAMGIGTIVSGLLSKTGMTFPVYIGAMIVAAIMRNLGEYSGKFTIHMGEINDLGGICLSLFLGIAMITLKLWQLTSLALPLIILLCTQTLFMALFSYFVVYNIMGRNYDAAILAAGTCGFGMGATPNAMANMQALTDKYAPSVKAYLLVPIVGSMFADFINSLVITFFINTI